MSDRDAHVLSFCLSHPWAIEEPMMPVIAAIIARHIARIDATNEIEAALQSRKNLPQPRVGSIAVIPMHGVIAPRMNGMSAMSGGTTFDALTAQLRTAVASKEVRTIVFDVDSPGGNVAGATEFAREVLAARAKKPIVAVAQYKMASAAMWAMSGATEIVASPSAIVGALGVISAHNDLSEALAKNGIKRRYLYAGEGKADGNDSEPLSADAEKRLQKQIDSVYDQMVKDVVTGRGTGASAKRVREEWKAHVYGSTEALSLGMIDTIATLDETVARLLTASPDASDHAAAQALLSPETTPQEPVRATGQELTAMLSLQRQVLEMQLSTVSAEIQP